MALGSDTQLSFSEARTRWGSAVDPGLLIVPNALIRHQHRIYLDTIDIVVLLNIVEYWDEEDGLPFPRLSCIAERIGMSKRTVERSVAKLAELGYLVHKPSEQYRGRTIRRFDLSGLIVKLQELTRQEPRASLRKRLTA